MAEDIIIRADPKLGPKEVFRQHVADRVKEGMFMAVTDNEIKVTVDNIGHILSLLEINTNIESVIDLIRSSLLYNEGVIDTDDFIELVFDTILPSEDVMADTLREAFSVIDVDGDGIITGADIYRIMLQMGEVISDEELSRMLQAVDGDGDGRATFEEFSNFLTRTIPESESVHENVQKVDTQQTESRPVSVNMLSQHKANRKLFAYAHMIKSQLSVISNMQTNLKVSQHEDPDTNTEQNEGKYASDSEIQHVKNGSPSGDCCTDSEADRYRLLSSSSDEGSTKDIISIEIKFPPTINDSSAIRNDPNDSLECMYKKTSPYYGRIRPKVFTLNPLPPLAVDKPERQALFRKGSEGSVSSVSLVSMGNCSSVEMVDKEQQTTGNFIGDAGQYELCKDSQLVTNIENVKDSFKLKSSRDSATLTIIHGIPKRLMKAKSLQNAILKRRNSSFEFSPYLNDIRKPIVPSKPTLRRSSSNVTTKSLNDFTDGTRPDVEGKNSENMTLKGQKPQKKFLPVRPQTAKPWSSFGSTYRRYKHTEKEGFEVKQASSILLSDSIKNESLYTEDTLKSQYHHGFRSFRPLARVMMTLQAAGRRAKNSISAMSSMSRLLEEEDFTLMNKFAHPATRSGSETKNGKFHYLNLELPPDKIFRPKLKRISTLSRIPINTVLNHDRSSVHVGPKTVRF